LIFGSISMSSSEKAPLVEDSDPGLAQVIASVECRTQNLELRTANGEPTLIWNQQSVSASAESTVGREGGWRYGGMSLREIGEVVADYSILQ
jgi:hypothetical protein